MAFKIDNFRHYVDLIDDWDAFADACKRPLPVVIWANPLRREVLGRLNHADGLPFSIDEDQTGGDFLVARLRARGYECEEVSWYPGAYKFLDFPKPGRTLEHLLGIYHVQEEVSLIPSVVLAPRPGELILDMCAAPGGKTAQISVAMASEGTVVANDVRIDRLRALRSNCERLGLLNVAMTGHDGTRYPLDDGPFDAILLDVPCSCEGNIRRSIGADYEPQGTFLTGRSGLQATLLGRAWKMLAPGGRLVYSTCTFAPEENEMVLDHSLRDDAHIQPFHISGLTASPGVTTWLGRELRPDCANVSRFWPHSNDTGGFTVALVRKDVAN